MLTFTGFQFGYNSAVSVVSDGLHVSPHACNGQNWFQPKLVEPSGNGKQDHESGESRRNIEVIVLNQDLQSIENRQTCAKRSSRHHFILKYGRRDCPLPVTSFN